MTYNLAGNTYSIYTDMHIPCDIVYTERRKSKRLNQEGSYTATIEEIPALNHTRLVQFMMDSLHPIYYAGVIYVYDDFLKKYVPDCGHIESFLSYVMNRLNFNSYDDKIFKEAKAAAKIQNTGMRFPFNLRNDAVNCRNGIVLFTINGRELIPHGPDSYQYFFNYCIDTDYNPQWECNTPDLFKVLDEWGTREFCINSVAIGIAQTLRVDSYKTAFMAEGEKNGGKTTWLDLVRKTLGNDCYSLESLSALTKSQFALASLEGKLVNVGDEAQRFSITNTEIFKRITGGVIQPIEAKYQPTRNGVVTAVCLFACNDLPDVSGINDDAFFDRWQIEEFKNVFPVNPAKKNEILSDIMCQQYLVRILQRAQDIMHNGFYKPTTSDQTEELWRSRSVGADKWLSECIETADYNAEAISLITLHHHYESWCKVQETSFPIVSSKSLKRKIQNRDYNVVIRGGAVYFRGLAFKTFHGAVNPNTPPQKQLSQQSVDCASGKNNFVPNDVGEKYLKCIDLCGRAKFDWCKKEGFVPPNCDAGGIS